MGSASVLNDDAREALRGFKQRVPEKAQAGKELDVTAYPLDGILTGNEAKLVAFVRSFGCPSPYSQIADGHEVRADQVSKVVFRLERLAGSDKDDEVADVDVVAVI